MNREEWLTQIAKRIEHIYLLKGYSLKKKPYRVTCGWPSRFSMSFRARRIGECHSPSVSSAGVAEVFISPTLDKPIEVAGTVAHELVHVAVGTREGHGGLFKRACRNLGLVGKATQATIGNALLEAIQPTLDELGDYPHKAIKVSPKIALVKPPPLKLECSSCGCVVRISSDWLEDAGIPTCGCGSLFVAPIEKED